MYCRIMIRNAPDSFSGKFNVTRNMVHLKMAKENVDYKKLQTDLEQQELEVFCNYQELFESLI